VQIRDREEPHIHTRYDLTVVLAKGHGTLWLDGVARPMQAGDGVFIPQGTPHWFVNDGDEPAVTVVTFAPPFTAVVEPLARPLLHSKVPFVGALPPEL